MLGDVDDLGVGQVGFIKYSARSTSRVILCRTGVVVDVGSIVPDNGR